MTYIFIPWIWPFWFPAPAHRQSSEVSDAAIRLAKFIPKSLPKERRLKLVWANPLTIK